MSKKIHKEQVLMALSFLIPGIIWSIIFILHQIYPFGGRQIAVIDGWHQYFPFLKDYGVKLQEGSSLLWSWTAGGTDYLAQISYYLASPLNLLLGIFPQENYREVITWLIPLKIGVAGVFMAKYLQQLTGKINNSLPLFSTLYTVCAWAVGYYWNVMWIDTFVCLPLVMLGVLLIIRENKIITYIVALAWSVLSNFYIGFYICLFVAIMFISLSIVEEISWKSWLKKTGVISIATMLSVGLISFLMLPAFIAMQDTYRASGDFFPDASIFYRNFFDLVGNLMAFTPATTMEGVQNLYTGFICIPLLGFFMITNRIKVREKIVSIFLLGFIFISSNNNILTYIWNGFHYTNGMPARFSFLFSFLLCTVGYRAFILVEETGQTEDALSNNTKVSILAMILLTGLQLVVSYLGPQAIKYVIMNAILGTIYITIFTGLLKNNKKYMRHGLLTGVLLFGLIEVCLTANTGVRNAGYSEREIYPDSEKEIGELLDLRESSSPGFYRTELIHDYNCNTNSVYGYDGLTCFSSTLDRRIGSFLKSLGMPADAGSNRYFYRESSPLTNMFMNLRYGLSLDETTYGMEKNWETIAERGGSLLLENKRYLPLGFMVSNRLLEYTADAYNPFLSQNRLFSLATGIEEDLYTLIDTSGSGHDGYNIVRSELGKYQYTQKEEVGFGRVKWNYTIPADGYYYIMAAIDHTSRYEVLSAGSSRVAVSSSPYWHIAPLGQYTKGGIVSISAALTAQSGYAVIYVARINEELLDTGYQHLSQERLELTEFTETNVKGIIKTEGGLLYTSIPYNRNWTAYVNGKEREIVLVGECMAALLLEDGEHEIEFRYSNKAFLIGLVISGVSTVAVLYLLFRKIKRRNNST